MFLVLLVYAVRLPLLLHVLHELLPAHQELSALLALPGLDLRRQLLLELCVGGRHTGARRLMPSSGANCTRSGVTFERGPSSPYLGETFRQLGPLLLLFEEVSSPVCEPRGICCFFLGMKGKTDGQLKTVTFYTQEWTPARNLISVILLF